MATNIDQRIVVATVQLESDVQKTHEIVHGDENTEVETDGGLVPSHAKVAKDSHDEIIDLLEPTVNDINEHADFVETKANESEASAVRSEEAAANAEAIVYEGDATVEPTPGSIPIADADAKIHHGWLPDQSIPYPDFWLPLNDSLKIEAGFGDYDQIDVSEAQDGSMMVDLPTRSATFSRASTATYINKSGELVTAEINEPRFEKEGILIEGSSTNYFKYSDSSTDIPDYRSTRVDVSASDLGGFEGEVSEDSQNSKWFSVISFETSGSSEENISSSFYIRGDVQNIYSVDLLVSKSTSGPDYSIGSLSPSDGFVDGVRYSLSGVTNDEEWARPELRVNFLSDAPLGTSVTIHKFQVEQKAFSSSYIHTEDSPVTRLRDELSCSTQNNITKLNSDITCYVKWSLISTSQDTYKNVLSSTNKSFIRIALVATNPEGSGRAGLWGSYSEPPISKAATDVILCREERIFHYRDNELLSERDISTSEIHESIFIGGHEVSGSELYGHVKDLRIWHTGLSEEQISGLY